MAGFFGPFFFFLFFNLFSVYEDKYVITDSRIEITSFFFPGWQLPCPIRRRHLHSIIFFIFYFQVGRKEYWLWMPNPAWIHSIIFFPGWQKRTVAMPNQRNDSMGRGWASSPLEIWKIPQWRRSRKYWITIRANIIIYHSRSIVWHVYVGLEGGAVHGATASLWQSKTFTSCSSPSRSSVPKTSSIGDH